MEAIFILLVLAIVGLAIFYLSRRHYNETDSAFSQANVSVNYDRGTITLGSRTFPVEKIRGTRWISGAGQHGNQSQAVIEIDDMAYPVHKVGFVLPSDAEKFTTRIHLAIERANGRASTTPPGEAESTQVVGTANAGGREYQILGNGSCRITRGVGTGKEFASVRELEEYVKLY